MKILDESRFGSKKYTPYQIYIKTLYELQKNDISERKDTTRGLPETKVNLAEFQEDAITRIYSRLRKYGGCIGADSVGLGKTWIAKKILEKIGYYERQNILVVCPAQLRDMWRTELKNIDVKENVISQESLASPNFMENVKKALGGRLNDVSLIVVEPIEIHPFLFKSEQRQFFLKFVAGTMPYKNKNITNAIILFLKNLNVNITKEIVEISLKELNLVNKKVVELNITDFIELSKSIFIEINEDKLLV